MKLIHGSTQHGLTTDSPTLQEAFLKTTIYAGVPAALGPSASPNRSSAR